MSKQKLFLYVVLRHPTEKEVENGQKSEIIIKPDHVLAMDEKAAAMVTITKIPESYHNQMDQLEVIVRPF